MATVFQRSGSDVWVAAYRVWNAKQGKFVWRQKSTGVEDKATAAGIAATLEQASEKAKAGNLSRERAQEMVNDILRLAGLGEMQSAPSLKTIANAFLDECEGTIADSTNRKYLGHWATLKKWAGDKIERGADTWTADDLGRYYKDLQKRFSGTTANGHLNFCSMLFGRAVAHGQIPKNPAMLVKRGDDGAVEKETFSRAQCAALYSVMRKNKAKDWTALLGLGWHTGHRIQDLLDIDPEKQLQCDPEFGWLLTFRPAKKKRKKNSREVILPLPTWLAQRVKRLGGFKGMNDGSNRSGRISGQFLVWMRAAGIDPCPIKRGPRVVHLRSFHSLRHSMTTRLTAAGITGELSRLVTDHESPKVQRRYVHAEIRALKEALAAARGRK